jgi:tRNA-intron endonuclease
LHNGGEGVREDTLARQTKHRAPKPTFFVKLQSVYRFKKTPGLTHVEDILVEQVFKDLQSRGFRILERLGDRMFIAEKKDKYLFYVMVEGVEVTVHTLLSVINMAETLSMPAVLALVSNDGTVTYYFVRKIRLPRNVYAEAV